MAVAKHDKMQRFILCSNIKRLTGYLLSGKNVDNPGYFRSLIRQDRRELAKIDAHEYGAFGASEHHSGTIHPDPRQASLFFDPDELESDIPIMILDPGPDLTILGVSRAYETLTGMSRQNMVGRPSYDVFPENPATPQSESLVATFESLKTVLKTKKAAVIPAQRYDIRGSDGKFVERYWRIENAPVLDDEEEVALIRHSAKDITADVKSGKMAVGEIQTDF